MLDNKNIAGYLLHILIFIKPILFILFILGKGMHIDIKTFTYSNRYIVISYFSFFFPLELWNSIDFEHARRWTGYDDIMHISTVGW